MLRWLVFAGASVVSIAAVTVLARRDSADPARCAGLVAMASRCCAEGQEQRGNLCVGRPLRCPPPLTAVGELGCVALGGPVVTPACCVLATGKRRTRSAYQTTVAPSPSIVEITEGTTPCIASAACRGSISGGARKGPRRNHPRRGRGYCVSGGCEPPRRWTPAPPAQTRRYPWGIPAPCAGALRGVFPKAPAGSGTGPGRRTPSRGGDARGGA
jgi:hypothetical protein